MGLSNHSRCSSSFDGQVIEYQPAESKWSKVGDLQKPRGYHAVVTVGTQELPCMEGETFNRVESTE